jgi:hypothetical protein
VVRPRRETGKKALSARLAAVSFSPWVWPTVSRQAWIRKALGAAAACGGLRDASGRSKYLNDYRIPGCGAGKKLPTAA